MPKRSACILLAIILATGAHIVVADDPPNPNDSKTIASFVKCLNDTGNKNASIADVIDACIPDKCTVTLTMSQESAQKACTLGGCQLPRVIFECPGPEMALKFRPSFGLCPTDSKINGEFGVNRIEVGEDTKNPDNTDEIVMKTADVKVPPPLPDGTPGTDLTKVDLNDVASRIAGKGTNKGCGFCHSGGGLKATPDGDILTRQINPFGQFPGGAAGNLGPLVIDTNVPGKEVKPMGKGIDGKDLMKQALPGICDCIKNNKAKIEMEAKDPDIAKKVGQFGGKATRVPNKDETLNPNPNPNIDVLAAICEKLSNYRQKRACGKLPDMPDMTGVACSGLVGGGKFLASNRAVSILQLDVSGNTLADASSFQFIDVDGQISAYNYTTRALITVSALGSLSGAFFDAGLDVAGAGTALVRTPAQPNGTLASVTFNASKSGSAISFEIRDAVSQNVLAGGTGEPQFPERTALEFTTSAP